MYQYDHNHSTICDACCPHDEGWWLLMEHYNYDNGKYCCRRGCGHTVMPAALGIKVPLVIDPAQLPSQSDDGVEK
jgi:hypothetical protein